MKGEMETEDKLEAGARKSVKKSILSLGSERMNSVLNGETALTKFFSVRDLSRKINYSWVMQPNPSNVFTHDEKPYYVYREYTVARWLFGPEAARTYEKIAVCFIRISPLVVATEWVSTYAITEFFADEVILLSLISSILKLYFFLRFNTKLMEILVRSGEFWTLIFLATLATIGLCDAFFYDIRCIWAIDFYIMSVFAAMQDATNKYSKTTKESKLNVIFSFILYTNFIVVTILIYFGYVPNLNQRIIYVVSYPEDLTFGNSTETALAPTFTIGSLNITLGLAQGILLYLFKTPYHLSRNQLAILQVAIKAKRVDLDDHLNEVVELKERKAKLQRLLSHEGEEETIGEDEEDIEEDDEAKEEERNDVPRNLSVSPIQADSSKEKLSKSQGLHKGLDILGIDTGQRLYRIFPAQNEYVVDGEPFRWKWNKYETLAATWFGPKVGELWFKLVFQNPLVITYTLAGTIGYPILYIVVLFGLVEREYLYVGIPSIFMLILYCGTLHYELLKKVLRGYSVRAMLFLSLLGHIGLGYAFNFDARLFGLFLCYATFLAFACFSDARLRLRGSRKFTVASFTYVYFTFGLILASFYLNLVEDLNDIEFDPALVSGRNTTIQLTAVGYSLYFFEIVFIFTVRNYYVILFLDQFVTLNIRLRYEKEAVGENFRTPESFQRKKSRLLAIRSKSAGERNMNED